MAKSNGLTEKEIETQILTWLNYQQGCYAFKVNTTGIYDPVRKVFRKNQNKFLVLGTSDIIGVYQGKFFAIEVKSSQGYSRITKRPNPKDQLQLSFQEQIRRRGGRTLIACSLDQVIPWFKNDMGHT